MEKDLEQEMVIEHRNEIAMHIGEDWEILSTFIGIPHENLDYIKEKYQDPKQRRLQLLREWKKLHGSKATYAKMAHGLETIGNRKMTEYLIGLLKHQGSDEICQGAKITKRFHNNDNMSKPDFIFALVLASLPLMICCVIYCIQNIHYWLPHAQANTSAIVQWSPQYHNNTNCSHSVGHDLPVLHDVFVGREEDIREIVSKTMKT